MVAQAGERWDLYWCREQVVLRRLVRGSRVEVEHETREVVLFGPPGGTDAAAGAAGWWFDEGSLHRAATEGVFRLMLQPGGRGSLLFVRHDGAVLFLGQDQRDALAHAADRRLAEHQGAPLHAWFMGRRLPLRGLGLLGVVGQFELARDVRIVLVRVEQDLFELYVATGRDGRDGCDLIGVYTSADLLHGDLGSILVSGPAQRRSHSDSVPREPATVPPAPSPSTSSPAPVVARAAPPLITDDDRRRLATCLTLGVFVGEGSSAIKYIYDGFRILVAEAREDVLIRTKALRELIEQTLKVRIPGVHRTYMRALVRFLEMTGLGRLEGRRVRIFFGGLRRGDSAVTAMLRERFASATTPEVSGAGVAPPVTAQAAPPVAPPPSVVLAPASVPPPTVVPPPAFVPPRFVPPPAVVPPADRLVADADTAPLDTTMDGSGRWQSVLRRDGPTFWKRVYPPSSDDPSQFSGAEPRGSPNDPGRLSDNEPRGPPKKPWT